MEPFKFDGVRFSMSDIIDIVEGWSDEVPPVWGIVVYSKTKGKRFFNRSPKNRLMMAQWHVADLKLTIQAEKTGMKKEKLAERFDQD
jgi:hypothetical protein